jgi:hypothetical protein
MNESLIPLTEVPAVIDRLTGGQQRPTMRTVYRWVSDGLDGAKLEVRRIGRESYTRLDWLDEFFDRDKQTVPPPPAPLPKRRRQVSQKALEREGMAALQELKRLGLA